MAKLTVRQAAKLLTQIADEGFGEMPFMAINGVEDVDNVRGFALLDPESYSNSLGVVAGLWCASSKEWKSEDQ